MKEGKERKVKKKKKSKSRSKSVKKLVSCIITKLILHCNFLFECFIFLITILL